MNPQQQFINQFNIGGINIYTNPLSPETQDGQVIRSVNFDSYPFGGKIKRPGYGTFLGTTTGASVKNLFSWTKDDGTSIFVYKFSGSLLEYYNAGIGTATDWSTCGNGTFTGSHIGFSILNNTMILGDGVGSTRHTTNGTSFTDTVLAPVGEFFEQFQNRVYIGGTSSTLFYSVTNDATNWNTSGTSDSSSLKIPGAGKINKVYKLGNILSASKTARNILQWDGFTLYDTSSNLGMSSPYSYGTVENSGFYINPLGVYVADGNGAKLISNAVTRYFYNDNNTGVLGTVFGSAPGGVIKYDYFTALGSIRDDFTNEPLNNAVLKYNFQKNEFLTYQFTDPPTSFATYIDNGGSEQFIYGGTNGQVYKYGGTYTTDNGAAIPCVLDMILTGKQPQIEKDWRWFWGFFNPGCEGRVQVALANTFTKEEKIWVDLGDATNGIVQYMFPTGSRSRLLYVRVTESSKTARINFYGCSLSYHVKNPG